MPSYEYRVVPAPRQPPKVRGLRAPGALYGHGLEAALNNEARQGWEFQRIETVEAELRRGWLSRKRTETVTVMVFRRPVEADIPPAHAEMWEEPATAAPPRAPGPRRGAEPVLRPLGAAGRD